MSLFRTCAAVLVAIGGVNAAVAGEWPDWENYRAAVHHPALTIKPADLDRARQNVQQHAWAKDYVQKVESTSRAQVARLTPAFVEQMIPATTPGDRIFTPCPACRDQGKPFVPHGVWEWDDQRPEELKCTQCGTIFPNEKYPESIELHAKWGGGQTLTFYGGKPFEIFGYKAGRPSFSGTIRARKVLYIADVCRNLGEAYALTGKAEFAAGAKRILLRLAAVYPNWMVHVGYGEYADIDPAVAAKNIEHLPTDELVYPPNKPDRKLHTGFWSAGRATGTGMEGYVLRRLAVAYDLTSSADGIWTDAERRTVEKNLLLEGTKLLTADPLINNKSVGNRSAVAMIGMCLGEPSLVRFGLKGFNETVDGWFLKDGGTPESFAYGMMTLNGVEEIVQAARGYSDPAGYRDADGTRIDHLDLYRSTTYGKVWAAMFAALQGDLKFPPLADSYRTSAIGPRQADLLVSNEPQRPEYLALLNELCANRANTDASVATYYRDPAAMDRPTPPVSFTDVCLPELRIGLMRTGADGRESLLTLDASHWGNHHHQDSLNIYYWKDGKELLSDFGYLWDHPDKHMTARTVAHSTVVIDGTDQVTKDRGGDVDFFETSDHVKAMRASSHAYSQASTYERTTVLVDHGNGKSYAVDFFRVQGGKTQDYVYHGVNSKFELPGPTPTAGGVLYDFTDVRQFNSPVPWRITWDLGDETTFDAWSLPQPDETTFIATGWGQRDFKNTDRGATVPYVVRRCTGGQAREFVSVFEGHRPSTRIVKTVRREGVAVVVERTDGGEDYIVSSRGEPANLQIHGSQIDIKGKVIVLSVDGGRVNQLLAQGQKRTPGIPGAP